MAIRCENCIHNGVCYLQEVTNDINKQLDEFGCEDYKSTADVVEVKRGKWLNIIFTQRYECSLCGNEIYFGKDKFCSECGAKMDGTSKERDGEK